MIERELVAIICLFAAGAALWVFGRETDAWFVASLPLLWGAFMWIPDIYGGPDPPSERRTAAARALAHARDVVSVVTVASFTVLPPIAAGRFLGLEWNFAVAAFGAAGLAYHLIGRPEPPALAVAPSFADHPGPVVLCVRAGGTVARGTRPLLALPVEPLSGAARRRLWSSALPGLAGSAPLLAARHRIEPASVAETTADIAAVELLEGRPAELDDVTASVRTRAGLSLSAGVALVRPTARWDQLVLPPDRLAQLREALDRLLHQSRVIDDWGFLAGRPGARGVRMLFAGPPGTGKSLSAEVLAGTLGVDLLTVDISKVVSKWIGETEKNLAEVFEAAERAQAVLFFDEADALFGKRTEVSDAHDRYANLETAYLLARLERFEGLAVLATNLRQNIDPAFTRRLEFVVDFDPPGAEERLALWRCHLPPAAPVADDVDLKELAAVFPVVGGVIRNAAVAAGFLAATDGGPIGRSHVISSLRREYEKSGRAFPGLPTDQTP